MLTHATPAEAVRSEAGGEARSGSRRCACGGVVGPTGECDACRRRRLHRAATAGTPTSAPSIVHDVLRSPGQPLEPGVRAEMDRRFQHDFSRVRIHADARAAESARAIGAAAYTVGEHVAFASGRYAPRTPAGAHVLAHELAHVRQQARNPAVDAAAPVAIGELRSSLEREADAAAREAVAGAAPRVQSRSGLQVQRHPDDLVVYTGGQSGRVGVFEAGALTYLSPAVSGHPGHTEWEVNVGPTPTGMYHIHPGITRAPVTGLQRGVCGVAAISSGYQEITSTDATPCAAGSAHYCNVPCPTSAEPARLCWTPRDCWGPKRIRIEGSAEVPKATGGTQHRDGFYLHGGNPTDPVSSGCVKSLDDDVFDAIRRLTGTRGRVRFCVGSACPPAATPAFVAAAVMDVAEAVRSAVSP
jgi:hypothetical protein